MVVIKQIIITGTDTLVKQCNSFISILCNWTTRIRVYTVRHYLGCSGTIVIDAVRELYEVFSSRGCANLKGSGFQKI